MILDFPTYLLLHTLRKPHALPNSLVLERDQSCARMVHIRPIKQEVSSVFSHLQDKLVRLFKPVRPGEMVRSILTGNNLLSVVWALMHTLKDEPKN